jgi:dTDP-glucose 4,6-dehydratase
MKVLVTGSTAELGKQVVNWFTRYYNDYQLIELNDLSDPELLNDLFITQQFDTVIHLPASSTENTQDLRNLLQAAQQSWAGNQDAHRFLLITTDPFQGELLLREYHDANGMNLLVSSCEPTFDSPDFPFVFSAIAQQNISSKQSVPVYAKGQEVPEWFWVEEQACAIDILFHQAEAGKTYSIGGMNNWKRSDLEYNPVVQTIPHHYSTANAR